MKIKWTLSIEDIMVKEYYDKLLKMTKEEQVDYLHEFMWGEIKDVAGESYEIEIIE